MKYYVSEFEWQQKVAQRIRECGQQLIDDAANIATGALNVTNLDILIDVFSDGHLGAYPQITITKDYIPQRHIEFVRKEN